MILEEGNNVLRRVFELKSGHSVGGVLWEYHGPFWQRLANAVSR